MVSKIKMWQTNNKQKQLSLSITKMKNSDVVIYIKPGANARETSFG